MDCKDIIIRDTQYSCYHDNHFLAPDYIYHSHVFALAQQMVLRQDTHGCVAISESVSRHPANIQAAGH